MLLILAMNCLTGCVTEVVGCRAVTLRDYDQAFVARFVEDFQRVERGSVLEVFVLDAVRLRDEVRACQGQDR